MVNSVLPPRIFPNQKNIENVRQGYEAATRAEIAKIVEKIPPNELAIQWDCSTEIQDAYGAIAGYPLEGAIERNLIEVRNLSPHIPREVALGYHFCFGTLGGWPRFAPDDLGQAVKLANAFVAASGRPVDWIHIPVLDRSDDSFYVPLRELEPGGARVYLGAIHNMPRFAERLATVRKYLSEFGLAAYAVSAGNPFPSYPISSMTICGPPRSPRDDPGRIFQPWTPALRDFNPALCFLGQEPTSPAHAAMSALPP